MSEEKKPAYMWAAHGHLERCSENMRAALNHLSQAQNELTLAGTAYEFPEDCDPVGLVEKVAELGQKLESEIPEMDRKASAFRDVLLQQETV